MNAPDAHSSFEIPAGWPDIVTLATQLWGEPTQRKPDEVRFGGMHSKCVKPAPVNTWFDHETNSGGGYIDLYEKLHGKCPASQPIAATYDYHDAAGALVFQVVRRLPKQFVQRRPDGKGDWVWNTKGIKRVPYGLPALLKAPVATTVYIPEGEKDCDALRERGLIATCNPGGAGKWPKAFAQYFNSRSVVILPDNDSAGADHARDVARKLLNAATTIHILSLPDLPPKGDVSDWLAAGGSVKELERLAAEAPLHEAAPVDAEAEGDEGSEGSEWSADGWLPKGFAATKTGIWYSPPDAKREWVCAPFQVIAETADEAGGSWGLLLQWRDRDGRDHQWAMPRKLLHARGNDIAGELDNAGLSVGTDRASHDQLKRLLGQVTTPHRRRCVLQTGWHQTEAGIVYVLPSGETFGPSEDVILQTDHVASHDATSPRGTLAEWQQNVARLAIGNHRLGLFMAASFAPPLLDITSEPTGGLHIHGNSQTGKTTLLQSAGSVWGRGDTKGIIRTWRATANGMEGVAAATCDALLALDEIGMVDPREAGEIVYSLANESGKARASRDGSARARRTWRLIFLSTGEVALDMKMGERGQSPAAGQEVRLANLPADAGAGLGVFQDLHGFASGDKLSAHLREAARQYYGTAARAFLAKLAHERHHDPVGLAALIQTTRQAFMANVPDGADGQVVSVARRFSLIAAAGELARMFGVLPWPKGEAMAAAASGLKVWITMRGGTGAGEDARAITMVRRCIERDGESRFSEIGVKRRWSSRFGGNDDERQADGGEEALSERPTINRIGFRRKTDDGWLYLIMAESWKSEVCKGLDPNRAAAAVHAAGFLEKGEGRHWQKKHRIPGEQPGRFYTIKGSIIK